MEVHIPWILHWDSSLASFSVKPTVQRSRSPRIVPRAPPPSHGTGVWPCARSLVPSENVSISLVILSKKISKNPTNYAEESAHIVAVL